MWGFSCTWVQVCAEAKGLCGVLFLRNHLPWSFWDRASHCDLRFASSVRLPSLASPVLGSQLSTILSSIHGFWESNSGLHCLYLTQRTTSSVPIVLFLEIVKARKRPKYADGTQTHCGQGWGKRKRRGSFGADSDVLVLDRLWLLCSFKWLRATYTKKDNLRLRTLQLNRACFRQRWSK